LMACWRDSLDMIDLLVVAPSAPGRLGAGDQWTLPRFASCEAGQADVARVHRRPFEVTRRCDGAFLRRTVRPHPGDGGTRRVHGREPVPEPDRARTSHRAAALLGTRHRR